MKVYVQWRISGWKRLDLISIGLNFIIFGVFGREEQKLIPFVVKQKSYWIQWRPNTIFVPV